ncbi:MAG: hypothetical protein AABY40_00920 [Nanoarchaeota archaeon]
MSPSLEYLAMKAAEIKNNPNGNYDCTNLAREMKKIILAEKGREAEVLRFAILNQYGEPLRSIAPLSLPGKNWLYHDVCGVDKETIYDPFAGKDIISIEEYALRMFGEETPYHAEEELYRLYEKAANRNLSPLRIL